MTYLAVKNDTTLPWNCELLVYGSVVKETLHIIDDILLHLLVENDIVPRSILDRLP